MRRPIAGAVVVAAVLAAHPAGAADYSRLSTGFRDPAGDASDPLGDVVKSRFGFFPASSSGRPGAVWTLSVWFAKTVQPGTRLVIDGTIERTGCDLTVVAQPGLDTVLSLTACATPVVSSLPPVSAKGASSKKFTLEASAADHCLPGVVKDDVVRNVFGRAERWNGSAWIVTDTAAYGDVYGDTGFRFPGDAACSR